MSEDKQQKDEPLILPERPPLTAAQKKARLILALAVIVALAVVLNIFRIWSTKEKISETGKPERRVENVAVPQAPSAAPSFNRMGKSGKGGPSPYGR